MIIALEYDFSYAFVDIFEYPKDQKISTQS